MELSEWIKLIDRDGLVHVTDDCFQLWNVNLDWFNNKHVQDNESFSRYMESKLSSDDGVFIIV